MLYNYLCLYNGSSLINPFPAFLSTNTLNVSSCLDGYLVNASIRYESQQFWKATLPTGLNRWVPSHSH